jgi:hypothetical protein
MSWALLSALRVTKSAFRVRRFRPNHLWPTKLVSASRGLTMRTRLDFKLRATHQACAVTTLASISSSIGGTLPPLPHTFHKLTHNSWKTGQSQEYFKTGSLPPISSSRRQTPWGARPYIYIYIYILQLNPCGHSPYVTSPLAKGCVCLLWMGFAFVKCT